MKSLLIPAILLGVIALSACTPDGSPDKTPKIAGSQRAALDKAKALEATMNEQALKQQQQIDQATNL
jgi:hypothetical protein